MILAHLLHVFELQTRLELAAAVVRRVMSRNSFIVDLFDTPNSIDRVYLYYPGEGVCSKEAVRGKIPRRCFTAAVADNLECHQGVTRRIMKLQIKEQKHRQDGLSNTLAVFN